jgi:ATP-binding cassette subfamily B protein
MELVKINSMFFPLMLLLVEYQRCWLFMWEAREVIKGNVTHGNIAEFIIYVNMLTWPVAALGWVTAIVQRAAASQERINEFMHTEPEIVSDESNIPHLSGKIEFNNVSFVYPDSGIKALEDISFNVQPGESLAVLGRTGSGKSTIANLLVRMYDAGSGKILIDDHPIDTISLTALRENIGYVPQDVFLFSDSIANNISFGIAHSENGMMREKIHKAAREAVIYDNIMEFEKNFDTMIGERGITLSGGQKQRVSIARCTYQKSKDPRLRRLPE